MRKLNEIERGSVTNEIVTGARLTSGYLVQLSGTCEIAAPRRRSLQHSGLV